MSRIVAAAFLVPIFMVATYFFFNKDPHDILIDHFPQFKNSDVEVLNSDLAVKNWFDPPINTYIIRTGSNNPFEDWNVVSSDDEDDRVYRDYYRLYSPGHPFLPRRVNLEGRFYTFEQYSPIYIQALVLEIDDGIYFLRYQYIVSS